MKPLVLTVSPPSDFMKDGFADLALWLKFFRFSWGLPPSQDELTAHLGPRIQSRDGIDVMHWSEWATRWNRSENRKHRDLSLADFCQHYETVELWFDVHPEDQLKLIWLLDYFRTYPEAIARLKLRLVDRNMRCISLDGIGDGAGCMAGISVADAGSMCQSAANRSERAAAAQADSA